MKYVVVIAAYVASLAAPTNAQEHKPEIDAEERIVLSEEDLANGAHHTKHAETFGKYVEGYNYYILSGIDAAQATAPDGGGYFIGITADPPESPIGYDLKLLGVELVDAPRKTSYCSGASFTAFVEALNLIFADAKLALSDERAELLRMQEPDGGRREDHVKFWGEWNADGPGTNYALAQYAGAGERVEPSAAKPGDFVNINWKSGGGHSVVFLGWVVDSSGGKNLAYWSSQKGTNGMGDQVVELERIASVVITRLTAPERMFDFEPREVEYEVEGSEIEW